MCHFLLTESKNDTHKKHSDLTVLNIAYFSPRFYVVKKLHFFVKGKTEMNGECLTLCNSMMLLRIFKQFFDWFLLVIWHAACIIKGG